MRVVHGKTGWIEVICGPMFSGKSEELIKRIRRAQIARRQVQIFKHAIDGRYDATSIVSHDQQRLPGVAVDSATGILDLVEERTVLVAIDEAQFFDNDLVEAANLLADRGKRVVLAGLERDYRGDPFGPMPQLLCAADYVTKQLAICMTCGDPANFTQRLTQATDQIVVGASETYEARCRRHIEPPEEENPGRKDKARG